MKWVSIALSVSYAGLALAASPGWAQDIPNARPAALTDGFSPGEVTPTPEMWFYQQYKSDYQDPKVAVRKKAEFRADQRQKRMAALKWFGFSNQRPVCSSDPFHGDWSPSWRSNNTFFPSRWQGTGPSWLVVRPEYYDARVR